MRRCRAWTLIEVLCVLAIIAVLCAILLPVVASAKIEARRPVALSQIRQLAQAESLYANDAGGLAVEAHDALNWHGQLSPYLPGVASLHPPLFAEPSRASGPNGYALNSCVSAIDRRNHDPARLVLFAEHALVKIVSGPAHGEVSVFASHVPDSAAVDDLGRQFPSSKLALEGVEAATKYQNRGVYAALDGHAAFLPPGEIDFHPGFPYACEPSPEDPSSPSGRLTYRLLREKP